MQNLSTVEALRASVQSKRVEGARIGFVPTMGALHAGHMALVRAAQAQCDTVVVSIFVNPKQFSEGEDLGSYPRTLEDDLQQLADAGVDMAYTPTAETIYPSGFQTSIQLPHIAQGLCGASRPNFFGGIATVVAKLLIQVLPDAAFFGEKDYQQLKLVERLVADLDMPVQIVGVPIIREADGLAMSSRNRYLSADERTHALMLYAGLRELSVKLKQGASFAHAQQEMRSSLEQAGFVVDYIELRDATSLATVLDASSPARILAAAMLGKTRLIDNIAV